MDGTRFGAVEAQLDRCSIEPEDEPRVEPIVVAAYSAH